MSRLLADCSSTTIMGKKSFYITIGTLILIGVMYVAIAIVLKSQQYAEDSTMPVVELTIPNDLPEFLECIEKNGNITVVNARELFSLAFEQGWRECWRHYKAGLLDPCDEKAGPENVQEFIFEQSARVEGFRKCRLRLIEVASADCGGNPARTGIEIEKKHKTLNK